MGAAFTYAVKKWGKMGKKNCTAGTFTNTGGGTGGAIYPGLKWIDHFSFMPNNGATTISAAYTQGTHGVTIVTNGTNTTGTWLCVGL